MNLADSIEHHAADRVALIDGDDEITYGDLRRRVASMRTHLVDVGIQPGDPVAIAAGNESLFAVSALAILGAGGIVMPLNPSSPPAELQRKLEVVAPRMVLVGEVGRHLLEHRDEITAELVDMSGLPQPAGTGSAPPIVDREPGDMAFYMSTSGVSGVPKVAMLTHRNLDFVQNMTTTGDDDPLVPSDITLGVLPFAHIFGLNVVLLSSLRIGACVVLQRRFDVDESLRLIRQHSVTMLTGAPPMWQRWAKADAPDDSLRTVRRAVSGAAALPIEVFTAIRDRYGVEIAEGYGLTETSPVITSGRGGTIKPTSVGAVMPGVEVVLVDPDGSPVEVGDQGEIVVRSPGVFVGYLDDPESTSSVLTDDGWFWTGDVGIFDDEGYLYLVDRVKDIIIVSGFNVYPSEVENVLMEHPDVRRGDGGRLPTRRDRRDGRRLRVGHRRRGIAPSARRHTTQSIQATEEVPLRRGVADQRDRQGTSAGAALMSARAEFTMEWAPELPGSDRIYRYGFGGVRRLVDRLWNVEVTGLEHIPATGPGIITPNHLSFCDSVFVPAVLPRRIWAIGKGEYMDSWKTKHLFPALGMIPVDRTGGDAAAAALDVAAKVLEGGHLFMIYPEGTRSWSGNLHKGRTGAARLAVRCNAPIIPVGHRGTVDIQPPDSVVLKPFKKLSINFGAPMWARDFGDPEDPRVLRRFTDAVMFEISHLSGQDYVDDYAGKPAEPVDAPTPTVTVTVPTPPKPSPTTVPLNGSSIPVPAGRRAPKQPARVERGRRGGPRAQRTAATRSVNAASTSSRKPLVSVIAAGSAKMPMSNAPLQDSAVMLAPVPATGPMQIVASTFAPEQ